MTTLTEPTVETPLELRVKALALIVSPVPSKPTRKRRVQRSRKTVLYALAGVVLANILLGITGEYSPRLKDPAFGDKWAALRRQIAARPNDPLVLSLGSSRTLLGFHGIQAESDLAAQTGRSVIAYNFGTPAAGPITNWVYLRRLLQLGIKPDLLLVEVMPGLCSDGPNGTPEQLTLNGERLCFSELEIVEQFGFDPREVRHAWRESVLIPFWKLRFPILGRVVPSWLPWNLRFDWSRAADHTGWATPPRQEITPEERSEREFQAKSEYANSLASVSEQGRPLLALRELLVECQRRGIPTRIVIYPEGSSFRVMYPAGLSERFTATLQTLATEFQAPLIDARNWLPDDGMYDGHHMFRAGAEAFTKRLTSEVIAPALSSSGRVP